MNSNVEFTILMRMARDHMENNGFSPTSVSYCMRTWRSVYNFALSKGINQYSAELAEQYMLEKYNLKIGENSIENTALSPYVTQKIRALRALTDFKLTGFVNKESKGEAVIWPVNYKESCERYMNHFRSLGYKDSTIRKHELILCRFSKFLDTKNIKPEEICAEHIYEYFKTLAHYSKGHLANVRVTLIHTLKNFYKNGYCPNDLSPYVPMVRYYSKSKVDKVWSQEEISKMLECIDRSNPIGKRNYAIMLIASNLGLRTSDILALTIDNFNWRNNEINLVQYKTQESLCLPLSPQIGSAVIDYWKNGRPDTVTKEIFVQHTLPYQKLTDGIVYHMFNKYYNASGITSSSKRRHGLHSLRHSLASRLLEKNTPVNIIGNILGHVDSNSASHYLSIDIDKLRHCSLEVPDYE